MCDFHSILGVAIGDSYEIRHDATNSHSGMAGKLENRPNRKPVIFEAEASAETLLRCADVDSIKTSIIRSYGECPEPLVRKIVGHYQKVKEALMDGSHLTPGGYFSDVEKYGDVYCEAINRGKVATFATKLDGYLYLGRLTSIPEKLKLPDSIGGNLYLGRLTSIPEKLKLPDSIGGYLYLGSLDKSSRSRLKAKYPGKIA